MEVVNRSTLLGRVAREYDGKQAKDVMLEGRDKHINKKTKREPSETLS